jgi:hypothetical protein
VSVIIFSDIEMLYQSLLKRIVFGCCRLRQIKVQDILKIRHNLSLTDRDLTALKTHECQRDR